MKIGPYLTKLEVALLVCTHAVQYFMALVKVSMYLAGIHMLITALLYPTSCMPCIIQLVSGLFCHYLKTTIRQFYICQELELCILLSLRMITCFGRSHPHNTTDTLVAYLYACNLWVRLVSKDVNLIGVVPPSTYAHAMAMDPESGAIFVVGGFDGGIDSHVTHSSPHYDLCALWPGKCHLPGCSYCAVIRSGSAPNSTFCYNNARSMSDE